MKGDPFAPVERIVKPRQSSYQHMPIIVIEDGMACIEDAKPMPVVDIPWHRLRSHIVAGRRLAEFVAGLSEHRYANDPDFQWRAVDRSDSEGASAYLQKTTVDYFSWPHKSSRQPARRFTCLDIDMFYANSHTTESLTDMADIMTWAKLIRDFCKDNDLVVRSSASGIAAQFLTDPRFYPEARRKVPAFINAAAREHLPGNYYRLEVVPGGRRYQALEIDQTRAHHYHAYHTRLPDANSLVARGDTHKLEEVVDLNECRDRDFSGLLYVRLFRDRKAPMSNGALDPRGARKYTERFVDRWVWSNELSYLSDIGYRVCGIIASYGSTQADQGLGLYAQHACHELDRLDNSPYIKPILLCTYGLLATRPRAPEAVYRQAKGEPVDLLTSGRDWLSGFMVSHTRGNKLEPKIVNVLHRGLIEAATRVESLSMAQHLTNHGVNVLQIYADAIIVEDDLSTPLPFMPDPWRVKGKLSEFRPINEQAYISLEQSRLPGLLRQDRLEMVIKSPVPHRPRYWALTGDRMTTKQQLDRGLKLRHI